MTGRTMSPSSCLARKANPVKTPAATSQPDRPRSRARMVAYTEAVSKRVSNASGLLYLNISEATGVRATTAPAMRPAPGVKNRRTHR